MKIMGYTDRLSCQPGEQVTFMVSAEDCESYQVQMVRLINGDANPAGPGFKSEKVEASCNGPKQAKKQALRAGSYVHVARGTPINRVAGLSLAAFIYPTTPMKGRQVILERVASGGNAGFRLLINAEGAIQFESWDAGGKPVSVQTGKALLRKKWYFVGASFAPDDGISAFQQALIPHVGIDDSGAARRKVAALRLSTGEDDDAPILMAASRRGGDFPRLDTADHFNGKLDRPTIVGEALNKDELRGLAQAPTAQAPRHKVLASWDFSQKIESDEIRDASPHCLHGRTVNLPARGMTGFNWDGSAHDWKHAPEQYGAIHFHDDDLYDAGWEPSFSWQIPAGLRSGIYAAEVKAGEHIDHIVFFVRPPRGTATARAALLIPTASYLAYANDHLALNAPLAQLLSGRLTILNEQDLVLQERRELGLSCYDTHSDGSGVCYSSRLRPLLNMRPNYTALLGGFGSSLWQFNADTHITDWLEESGYDYDIITDEDLHAEGLGLLENYKVVLTGTHPEYHSVAMWNAIHQYTMQGGRLMYLGGNGFYWRIAFSNAHPGALEVRRAEDGTRTWVAEPGEYYHSFTGEYGGLWRRQGRPPQALVGVGFIAQGFDVSSHYVRAPGVEKTGAAFIFDGVDDEIIGDFGLIGGGAAGLELDHADPELGTPPNAVVLATSTGHTDLYQLVNEEVVTSHPGVGGRDNPRVRSQLLYYETPNGGAVFSTGSIAWCGSLSHNNYQNNVSAITRNVLDRFIQ